MPEGTNPQEPMAETTPSGISVRKLNTLTAVITLVIAVALLFSTYQTMKGYRAMKEHTDNYIEWQKSSYEMQAGSDYLTEQVRCFVETGDLQYLVNYMTEANVTRRRDNAIQMLGKNMAESASLYYLDEAMRLSVELMNREYYAMRLTSAAYAINPSSLPEEILAVTLSEEDQRLDAQGKEKLARSMVFDEIYHDYKTKILTNTQSSLSELAKDISGRQIITSRELHNLLSRQQVLIICLIVMAVLWMLVNLFLVISPLLRAVVYIGEDQPIPVRGSAEFKVLARTYNLAYQTNREQKERLAFEASHDALTGLYNRGGYDFLLENTELESSALLLIDIDRFKQVNDSYGHEVGNRVLAKVAGALAESFRQEDHVCRIGGDEFAVIMVRVKEGNKDKIEEKIHAINEALRQEDDLPAVSVSCGVAFGNPSDDPDSIFRVADVALYAVKNAGGRGCRFAERNKTE